MTLSQAWGDGVPLKAFTTRRPPRHGHLQEEKLEARSCHLTEWEGRYLVDPSLHGS